jgi:ABC-type sugar transport system ATPase subunit
VGYAAAGALPDASGHWEINGASFDRLAVRDAIDAGLGFVPADRVAEGLIREFTVLENLSLAALSDLGSSVRLSRRVEREQASAWLSSVGVRADAIDVPVATLSGGNQQKIVFGRWLWRRPAVLVLCEPTAGVDIGARHALHELLREQAAAGLAVLITTSDLDDLVEVCDRVLVMRNGIVERELTGAAISTPTILAAMETDSGPIRP